MDAHERYEELAVGHVLGGLAAADAADFRSHLLSCRDCRLRVAELRDIAADLAAAEREERAEARVRTEVARRVDEVDDHGEPPRRPGASRRHLGVATVLVAVVVGLLAFWNLHLRTQGAVYAQAAERATDTLRELAEGVPVVVETRPPTTGIVVVDGDEVAFTLAGLPALGPDERFVVWLVGTPEGDLPAILARSDEDGALAGLLADGDAQELVVTVERGELAATPTGTEVVRADLRDAVGAS